MKSKSQFSFVLIIITALLLGSCSPARSLNMTVTSQVTVTSIQAAPEAPSTPTPKPTDVPATATKEMTPTPDPKFHELTAEEIDNLETIEYIKISSAEKQKYVDKIATDPKIHIDQGAKLSESFADTGYQKIQVNLIANENIIPRFALEIDGVKVVMYEVKIQNPDGTVYHGAFIVSNAGTVPTTGGSWQVYDTILQKFQNGSHKECIIHLVLQADQSTSGAKNPNALVLTNVVGKESTWDSARSTLISTDAFAPDMSATIWWAKSMK